MRDIFPRESAANPEPFTGERLTAAIHGQVEIEHYHRYLFSRPFCRGKDVLDVASGEGYGAAQLAQVARSVVGLEVSATTVRSATENFPRPNLRFVQGDARALPLAAGSFDIVTSFETIEHFDRQEDFVAEVRRVLRPDGCFIVSTPDRDIYSAPGEPPNPYHVIEFDRSEFLALLHRHFACVSLLRQRPVVASALVPEQAGETAPLLFERVEDSAFSADGILPRAPYFVALASAQALPAAPFSLLIDRSDIDNIKFVDQQAELDRLRPMLEAATRDIRESQRTLAESHLAHERTMAEVVAGHQRVMTEARAAHEQTMTEARAAHDRAMGAAQTAHAQAIDAVRVELDRVSGSLRLFLRGYLPRLRRHLFGG